MMGSIELEAIGDVEGVELAEVQAGGIAEVSSIEPETTGQVAARRNQRGMVSAEWAVGIIAAVALAGVLIAVITNGPVQDMMLGFILEVIASFSDYIQ